MRKAVTPDKFIEDLQVAISDAEALLKATAAQPGEKIQEVRARTEGSLLKVKARLGDLEDEALKRVRAIAGEAENYVQTNPWQTIGAAAGVGLLLGLMISRR
jgi:ElaB/YqjD/DUF883 family membrane-anchored ribosome-binding protein